jgi:hypothetical protein
MGGASVRIERVVTPDEGPRGCKKPGAANIALTPKMVQRLQKSSTPKNLVKGVLKPDFP